MNGTEDTAGWLWFLKDSSWLTFFIGLALAIPLSIIGNLLTGPITTRMSRYSTHVKQKKLSRIIEEFNYSKSLSENPNQLQRQIFYRILLILVVTSVVGAVSAVSYTTGNFIGPYFVGAAIGSILSLLGGIIALNIGWKAIELIKRVDNFGKYANEVRRDIARLNEEVPPELGPDPVRDTGSGFGDTA